MKRITQAEFDAIPRDENGYKICPSGDYTEIKTFPEWCSFGERSSFGEWSSFGVESYFGADSIFGEWSNFGERSNFGEWSSFGARSSFGEWSIFGEKCSFGEWSSFGEKCSFGAGCSFENGRIVNGTYFACDRIGSANRKAYFFRGDNGTFVRVGCFFGTFDEFAAKVAETHGGTKYEREYLAALELAKIVLEVEDEENK